MAYEGYNLIIASRLVSKLSRSTIGTVNVNTRVRRFIILNLLKKTTTKRFLSRLLLAILVIISYKLIMHMAEVITWLKAGFKILTPFLYGFVIAYLLNMPCSALERYLKKANGNFLKRRARGISVLIVYILLIIIIVVTINTIIPSLQRNISDFILNFNTYYNNAVEAIKQLPLENTEELDLFFTTLLNKVSLKSLLETIGFTNIVTSMNVIFGFTSVIFNGIIAIISSIYLLLETHNAKKYVIHLTEIFLSERTKKVVFRYSQIISDSFKKFISCQLLDSCILGVITTIEFTILGSRHAMALGVMLAVLNIIPYFGSIFGTIIAILVIASTNGIGTGLATAVVLLITQQIDANVIQPKLMGNSFSLSPALIVIGISIGGAVAGVWGMIVAIPIINIIKQITDDIIKARENYLLESSLQKEE
ncbi:AI-2E family transporter [Clostridium sp. HBUAS56010]|uniref:AI-2E family transporter n=1 Tax=Clostridium sp. HBUAS56010 TaxID=2571127 RepID=UPI00117753C6|nr:AI-2E family transporter [Clostridium sp. HBUAS56010]